MMYAWGSTVQGELGLGGIEEEHILTPTPLNWTGANTVIKAALGENHTVFLTEDGKVYSCGSNDFGQLGHSQPRKRPQVVSGLEAHPIMSIACGSIHSMALNEWGQVFSWGSDNYGQLGHELGKNTLQSTPKLIKLLVKYHIIQIAAGQRHSLALSNGGEILSWGANDFGQLGLGYISPQETTPCVINSLCGLPVAFIGCGGNHSFSISKSGAVYGWGKNTRGQLGLNDVENKIYPTQLRTLRNRRVSYISCGEEFTTFLTLDGAVFSCGAGMYGQLGHGNNATEIVPKQVFELMGLTITQISCGRQHCLAFVPSRGRVYSFGLGGAGQLGLRQPHNASTPQVVQGPWVSPSGVAVVPNANSSNMVVKNIFAGGDHCFVLLTRQVSKIAPSDYRNYETSSQILTLTSSNLEPCVGIKENSQVDQDILKYLEVVFNSMSCFNGSFLVGDNQHYSCTSGHHGVEIGEVEKTFSMIARTENKSIKELIWNAIVDNLLKKFSPSPPDVETLRVYLILPLYHQFINPKQYVKLQTPFASALLNLQLPANRVVGKWYRSMSSEYYERLVVMFKSVVSFIVRHQNIRRDVLRTVNPDPNLETMLNMLRYLNTINNTLGAQIVSYDTFYITDLSDYLDLRMDYYLWLTDPNTKRLFLCNYPFIFDAQIKTTLLQMDQDFQMRNAMEAARRPLLLEMFQFPTRFRHTNEFLVLNVTRENIVDDTVRELGSAPAEDLKKPLKIKFCGEEAEDAGGVRKEFFFLLMREILDPKFGMFKEFDDTRALWFEENSFEGESGYYIIGIICGLVIYNFTILDLPFPLALYKKLLEEPVCLSDLKDLSPVVASSLQSLLDYKEADFQDVFSINFEISSAQFGATKVTELKPNGSNIPVTQDNKQEYVDLYVDYILNISIKAQYDAFHKGFMKVCEGRVLRLFHSHELMAAIVGNENYDWDVLEESAEYKNGYCSSHRTIRWFWEVIHELPLVDKKKFLLFLTGSDRIPIQGMQEIRICIQATTDDKFLPVAHTCFNLLDLPVYNTKEKLKYKLMQAIQQTRGFHLV